MVKKILFTSLVLLGLLFSEMAEECFADASGQGITAISPDPAGLVAHYEFEGDAADTSIFQPPANGTLVGNPTFAPGVWGGAANGVLDPVNPERVEDIDDDGILDNPAERDGSASGVHDDGDNDFDGDYPVQDSPWKWDEDLSPHDIDNDGKFELPLVPKVSDIINDYSRAHVVMRTCNHEMGHSVGKSGHCGDITCAMYGGIPNYNRHGHFCNGCRSVIRIHNN
jgi:hypothetical protein